MEWSNIIVLSSSFFVLLFIGVPISFSIGIASLLTIMLSIPFDAAIAVISQKMASGLDSFSLLAIPFFILAGNIMNRGGIAMRLIEFAKVIGGRLPGSLAHVNVLANMMFGSISGSAVASGAAMGGIMSPLQKKEGYDPAFSAAVNIASCPTGLFINFRRNIYWRIIPCWLHSRSLNGLINYADCVHYREKKKISSIR